MSHSEEIMNRRKIGRGAGALLLLALFCVIASAPVSAYSYGADKWGVPYYWSGSIPASWYNSINSAAAAWNNAGSKFAFTKRSTTLDIIGKASLPAGQIAQTLISAQSYRIYKVLTNFSYNVSWSTTGQSGYYDVQNAATHEFGHWLKLNDLYGSSDTEKTMYGYISTGETKKRTLHSDDIAGIKYIYGTA
ncbi:MAG: matrixin family metalloprotease [Candidatus Diapherotrites archaeon]